jgi:O-acetyl-ADP-ribose deacetylase (regulator of RNase III)
MVKLIKGNLFESDADIIAHGVNCVGGFRSGIAGQIAKLYPEVKEQYLKQHEIDGWKLGDVQFVPTMDGTIIANCATQKEYYPRDKVHADYYAIRSCMEQVKFFAQLGNQKNSIAIPKIGCGLAGGDWKIVSRILEEVFTDHDVHVYHL